MPISNFIDGNCGNKGWLLFTSASQFLCVLDLINIDTIEDMYRSSVLFKQSSQVAISTLPFDASNINFEFVIYVCFTMGECYGIVSLVIKTIH